MQRESEEEEEDKPRFMGPHVIWLYPPGVGGSVKMAMLACHAERYGTVIPEHFRTDTETVVLGAFYGHLPRPAPILQEKFEAQFRFAGFAVDNYEDLPIARNYAEEQAHRQRRAQRLQQRYTQLAQQRASNKCNNSHQKASYHQTRRR